MIKDPTLTVFPNLRLLIQIALTLPVTSNEAERSFSGMRRVFTWLRTSMGTERLSNLSRMVAHPDRVKSIPNQKIVNKFNWNSTLKAEFCIFV